MLPITHLSGNTILDQKVKGNVIDDAKHKGKFIYRYKLACCTETKGHLKFKLNQKLDISRGAILGKEI